ncbi:protein DEEPER ROOTING 1 [Mercurialis annua]|uniref:protein DEEPER ROOTING 1 n=1 Tax=Mercurialis annua TaxID=3986 RepID=UPI0024ADF08C|nr:protein DEEPER ROOTING 1 [Mercurialis annua]
MRYSSDGISNKYQSIFSWMQNKFNARLGTNKLNPISVHCKLILLSFAQFQKEPAARKEEFSDWPHELLAIGTFGSNHNAIKEENIKPNFVQENQSQHHLEQLTPEEVQKIQNELNLLLHKQDGSTSVNGNSILEDDEEDCSRNNIVVGRSGRGLYVDNTNNNAINKKSFSILLKKMFVCRGGFAPTPSPRDQIPESRLEKILRAILHKKIYPQNPSSSSSSSSTAKKYLENKHNSDSDDEDDNNRSKWVKTDSEYIVLEI